MLAITDESGWLRVPIFFIVQLLKQAQLLFLINVSTSARVGKEGCAPNLVVASAPAAFPKRIASGMDLPSPKATAKAPIKASPAAVVSTGLTLNAG
jgi:hypothetical protein